jgi:hypothetical protein
MRLNLSALGLIAALAAVPAITLSQTAGTPMSPAVTMMFVCHAVPNPQPVSVSGDFYLVVAQASTKTTVACRPPGDAMRAKMGMQPMTAAQKDWVRERLLDHQFQTY